ncbi:esterase family protein [Nocardioides sp. IC4_145]|uniref:alpha/beta hydrolase n=1 Tax=Nocardioides sp. IC4_145 TaxID=2714037 RepID=UPI00140C1275|nr:alpha/beta hydrolase family protein [Nocardioides sp. IC4_145]NHC21566.1 esterase family protein [Nocardioides sp. IC4_145]
MTRRTPALLLALLLTLATLAGLPATSPAAAQPQLQSQLQSQIQARAERVTGPFRDGRGITVVSAEQVGGRQWRLVVRTAALARPVRVAVLLPRGYAASDRRYPVLHLLHGTSGGATDWIEQGGVVAATRTLPLVVVMPDGGYDGNGGSWWTDWVDQDTPLGTARWETFHVEQLVPWIDDNLRTVRARHGRAIAGLSQGGFGAFSYAARHPDRFVSAASFSGAPDIARNPLARTAGAAVVGAIMGGLNGVQPFAAFGDPVTNAVVWQGHNPADLVTNLRHTDLHLWTANGLPGEHEEQVPDPGAVAIETITHLSTLFFAQAADAAGVRYRLTNQGPGTHTWPYWSRYLRAYLPRMLRAMAERRSRPATVQHRAIERTWSQWGWRVATRRTAEHAFTALRGADRGGFTLVGGAAVVRTPRVHRPRAAYAVRYRGGSGPARVRADAQGRVEVHVRPDRSRTARNSEVHVALQPM